MDELVFHESHVYHAIGNPNKLPAEKIIEDLRINGLRSHNTMGRCNLDDPTGNPTLPLEHRIWISTRKKGSFQDYNKITGKDEIVLKIPADKLQNYAEEIGADFLPDDQFFSPEKDTGFIRSGEEFSVPPSMIEVCIENKCQKLNDKKFRPAERTLMEQVSPWIRKSMEKLYEVTGHSPNRVNNDILEAYCNCTGHLQCGDLCGMIIKKDNLQEIDAELPENCDEYQDNENNDEA